MNTEMHLAIALSAAVPLWIEQLRALPEETRLERGMRAAQIVAEKGDVIQFRSKRKGETAAAFNALAEGLACLAFTPGGVSFRSWGSTSRRSRARLPPMARKQRATSKTGRKYERSEGGKWVHVREYRRTKPSRKATPGEKRVRSCAHTRRKKQMGPRRKR